MFLRRDDRSWRRGRVGVLLGLVVVVVTASSYVGWRLADGGRVTEVGVDRAVEEFREQIATTSSVSPTEPPSPTTEPPRAEPSLPAYGVYTYVTVGYDEVDVLTGARHIYPGDTTITVLPHGCGVRLRWDVAVQRWDTWDWCLDGDGVSLVAMTGFHEFFGVGGRKDLECSGEPRPLDAEPGTTWMTECAVPGVDLSVYRGVVLGRETLVIEEVEVEALHVRQDVEVTGSSTGTQTIEGWYRITDGLPLREILAVNTAQDTVIGTANFEERSTIELVSLTPET